MSAIVDSWSCPTTIYAGAGALAHLPAAVAAAPVVLVADARVWPETPVADALGPVVRPSTVVLRTSGDGDEAFLRRVTAALAALPGATIVALGGGSILDVARLAALAAREVDFAAVLTDAPARQPMRVWPAARDAANPVVCIPTTLGTAAEVSPIAMLRRGGRTNMYVSPALRARVAILDPSATVGHPRGALVAGLLEPLSRVLVPAVAGAKLALQDGLGAALVQVLLDLGDTAGPAPDEDWRLTAALASSQTHTAFLGLGRSPFGHALWPFATEAMAALGISKAAALAMLMPAWLRGVAAGDLGSAFGSAERVQAILGQSPDVAARRLREWLGGLGLAVEGADMAAGAAGENGSSVAHEVASGVRTTWQATGFFLPGATSAEIEWLAMAALGGPPAP